MTAPPACQPNQACAAAGLWLVLVLGGSFPLLASTEPAPSAPSLTATVALERTSLQAGDAVALELWVANSSEIPISEVNVRLDPPAFFVLSPRRRDCKPPSLGPDLGKVFSLGPLAPHQVKGRRLCLRVGPEVSEHDLNLLFIFLYLWQKDGAPRAAFVPVVQPVQVGLFGTQGVGGFSLRLVAFVLPGLLLWAFLRWFRFPGVGSAGQAEQAAFSVLSSALLIGLASKWSPAGIPQGMSLQRLAFLCALAAGLGAILGLLALGSRALARRLRESGVVNPEDPPEEALAKLIGLSEPGDLPNALVKQKSGEEFMGSLFSPVEGGYILLGWFELEPQDSALRQELEGLKEKRRWKRMLARARKSGLQISPRDSVQQRSTTGAWQGTGEPMKRIGAEDLESHGRTKEGPPGGPLSLA